MILVEVTKISFYPPSKGYAVLLQEVGGQGRKIPVIVGSYEAQAIALALESIETPRPMTHDLVCDILEATDVDVREVVITELLEGTFYAEIRIGSDQLTGQKIDSRPSDAVAIALRMSAPIYVAEPVMAEAGFIEEPQSDVSFEEFRHGFENSKKLLQEKLQQAIEQEEYEMAADLRDKIQQIEGKKQ